MRRLRPALWGLWLLAAGLTVAQAAFSRGDWTLPPGFEIELYTPTAVPSARSLVLSKSSKLNGAQLVYVSAMSFAGKPQSVSGKR